MNARTLLGLVLTLAGVAPVARAADTVSPEAEKLFATQVYPILQARCVVCHGDDAKRISGDLDLRTRESAFRGGESGEPAIVAGKPDDSPLYRAVARLDPGLEMPPKENDKLTPAQVAAIRSWIAGGAPWPDAKRLAELSKPGVWNASEGIVVRTSGGLSAEWTNRRYKPADLWAYQPLAKPADFPAGNPIDALINARLCVLSIAPAPLADRRTLIRRATFDLLGLPPTPDEVEAFVSDVQPDERAFTKVVDRLLASPHYGEQMARRWLDVVRYADSAGFANDYERGNAWRYRDYVVRAFNADKPYDQFVREQIAGDEIDPSDPELLIAVGFLRMGPWELTSMEVPKLARQRFLDDVTNIVGETFLGQALQCARCHDHKFDPVPTRDYYSIQACFATTQLAERPAPFLPQENTKDGFDGRAYLVRRQSRHERDLAELSQRSIEAARRWYVEKGLDPSAFEQALGDVSSAEKSARQRGDYEQARARMLKRGIAEDKVPPRFAGLVPEDFGRDRIARKGLERLAWELERYEPMALSVYDGATRPVTAVTAPQRPPADPRQGDLEATAILAGGDPFSPRQPLTPGVLSAVGSICPAEIPTEIGGRRRALADWIADPRNPLTPRVIVNRLWQWHFGQGLAGNPNNFGATGKRPTHPELLDRLATTLVERGWSLKEMHRLIMTSETYRRSCEHPDRTALAERDPTGTSYAVFQPRPLAAEEIRDAMLRVSGELNDRLGGVPVRPEINLEAALQPRQVMGTFAAAWTPSPLPADRHRRSLYALKLRGLRDPFGEVFNVPSPDLSCERREAASTTPQVFSLFNAQASYDRAIAFAAAVLRSHQEDEAAVRAIYHRAFGRPATSRESARAIAHWHAMTERHKKMTPSEQSWPSKVLREAVEENTGIKFTFVEQLDEYADFVPDVQAADVDVRTRGLAELCLVIFNSNEFVYVY
jgi:mono/diheme cytochrome c family protein